MLLLATAPLTVVTTQANKGDDPDKQGGEKVVEHEIDDVAKHEVDEE